MSALWGVLVPAFCTRCPQLIRAVLRDLMESIFAGSLGKGEWAACVPRLWGLALGLTSRERPASLSQDRRWHLSSAEPAARQTLLEGFSSLSLQDPGETLCPRGHLSTAVDASLCSLSGSWSIIPIPSPRSSCGRDVPPVFFLLLHPLHFPLLRIPADQHCVGSPAFLSVSLKFTLVDVTSPLSVPRPGQSRDAALPPPPRPLDFGFGQEMLSVPLPFHLRGFIWESCFITKSGFPGSSPRGLGLVYRCAFRRSCNPGKLGRGGPMCRWHPVSQPENPQAAEVCSQDLSRGNSQLTETASFYPE